MANKSENVEIAVLQEQVGSLNSKVDKLDGKIDQVITKLESFTILQGEIDNLKTVVDTQRKAHDAAINELKAKKAFQTYIVPVLVSFIVFLMTFFATNYFNNLHKSDTSTSTTTSTSTNK